MTSALDASTVLPLTGLTVEDARRTLSGLHFAKETLTRGEREILYVAEGLLRLLDETSASVRATLANPALAPVLALSQKPGVMGLSLYRDGVEACGAPGDSDASSGFVSGEFSIEDVRTVVGMNLPVIDERENPLI